MIELSRQAIFLQHPDGSAVLFDHDYFENRVRAVLSPSCDDPDSLASNAVNAVEYALRHDLNNRPDSPFYVKMSAVEALFVKILQSIGMYEEAAAFQRAEMPRNISQDELIASLLADHYPENHPQFSGVVRKVSNTLRAIGANAYGQEQLVLELARHFFAIGSTAVNLSLDLPEGMHDNSYMIPASEFIEKLSPDFTPLFDNRLVHVHSIDLRIFPSIYVEVRFFPLVRLNQWELPVTELSLQPVFRPFADCIDQLCIAVDQACVAHGADSITPIKLLLHFPDTLAFVSQAMGCSGKKAVAQAGEELVSALVSLLTRRPDKITCS